MQWRNLNAQHEIERPWLFNIPTKYAALILKLCSSFLFSVAYY
jgi:hypothetical protein